MPGLFRVIRPYRAEFPDPLIVSVGDRLRIEQKETHWTGWIWCIAPNGQSGWVPESWVDRDGDTCVLKRDYTAAELAVEAGELLTGELQESGWLLAICPSGQRGWIPLENVETSKRQNSLP